MKKLITVSIAALLLTATTVFAADCPDFTGTFQLASNPTELTLKVTQNKCVSVTFAYIYSNGEQLGKVYPLDNVRRQTAEDKTEIVYETSGIKDGLLQNLVEFYDKATAKTITAVSTSQIDDKNNLDNKSQYFDTTGKLYQTQDNYFTRATK